MHDTRVAVSSDFRVNTKLMCPPLVIFFLFLKDVLGVWGAEMII